MPPLNVAADLAAILDGENEFAQDVVLKPGKPGTTTVRAIFDTDNQATSGGQIKGYIRQLKLIARTIDVASLSPKNNDRVSIHGVLYTVTGKQVANYQMTEVFLASGQT